MSLSLSLNLDLDLGLGLGSKGAQRMFALRLGVLGPTDLSVVSFKGRERLSEPFRYDVVFATSAPETVVMSSLAHPASLALAVPGGTPRLVQGLAASITILGPAVHDRSSDQRRYRVRIVPRLWLLKHRRRNRVFQDKTVVQIARRLLDQAGIHHEFRVDPDDHAPYPFCYQRDETDHAFLHRILATAGIWYCFEHASGTLDALLPSLGGEIAGVGALAGGLAAVSGAVSLSASIEGVEEPLGVSSKLVLLDDPLRSPVVTAGGGDLVAGLVGKGMQALGSVVADATGGLVDLGGPPPASIPFDAEQRLAAHEERVGSFSLGKRVRPKTVRIHERLVSAHRNKVGLAEKDVVDLSVSASLDVGSVLGGGNVLDALHVKANLDVDLVPTSEVVRVDEYSEDPPLQRHPFERAGHDIRYAKRSLEQLRRDAMTGEGTSDSRRLAAGYRFRLEGHPVEAVDREYTVTSLDAEGLDPNELGDVLPEFLYRNRFEVVPATVRPRPEKPRRAPRLGLEVAQVVSPPGQDIYCDALGRVCVRFRWLVDDQGHAPSPTTMTDEDSTCWLPVAQPWAGPGYGAQFIPRVGTEVLVGFLGGHGERPVVVGALHTEENPTPWSMPAANTKTGIRSRSTPHGEGWSEISIDDENGRERMFLRAERDLESEVMRDQREYVARDAHLKVDHDRTTAVRGNDRLEVSGVYGVDVNTLHLQVAGDRAQSVSGDDHHDVSGNLAVTAAGRLTIRSVDARLDDAQGGLQVLVSSDRRAHVVGADIRLVEGRMEDQALGGSHSVVGTKAAPQSYEVTAHGTTALRSSGPTMISSAEEIVLTCGTSTLRLLPDRIELSAGTVTVAADAIDIRSPEHALKISDKLTLTGKKLELRTEDAALLLEKDAQLAGKKVKLGQPVTAEPTKDKSSEPGLREVRLKLSDEQFGVLANKHYELRALDRVIEGTTDGNGGIRAKVPSKARTVEVTVWLGTYPTGPTHVFLASVVELPPANTPAGARMRLHALGYGVSRDGNDPKELLRALREFQQDQGLPVTGELDAATAGALAAPKPIKEES